MTVTSDCNRRFQNRQHLYHYLSSCQRVSLETNQTQIISISLAISPVDPLAVLDRLAIPNQPSFYFEKQDFGGIDRSNSHHTAIAAIGSATCLETSGESRFADAHRFIDATLTNLTMAGEWERPFAGPHFFCSFTFFDRENGQPPQRRQQSRDAGMDGKTSTVFLPTWQVTRHSYGCTLVANLVIGTETNLEKTVDSFWAGVHQIQAIQYSLPCPNLPQPIGLQKSAKVDAESFQATVRAALHEIQRQVFNKVVVAHAVDVHSPLPFQPTASLANLRSLYPDCYLFSVSNGKGQAFVGASPERLVSLRDRQLATDALAGSAPRGRTPYKDARLANGLLNSPKEIHEHQVVAQFIAERLRRLGLQPQRSPLRLLQLSNIQHLHTPIQARVPSTVHLLDVVSELHPTPAVAGMPRPRACDFIRQHEPFERARYAAPIGWVDHHGNGEFAVGIRSALIQGCQARLYAGAGIVTGSNPEQELAEVQLKLQALLSALV